MNTRSDRLSIIFITLVVAFVLTLLPLPPLLDLMRPYWVALVIIYWCLETQDRISLGLAFIVGIVLDLLGGSLLGLHALSLVVIVDPVPGPLAFLSAVATGAFGTGAADE